MLLSDILIVDATDRFGWMAGRVLADLGGDVVRLEAPGSDRSRPDWRAFNVNKRVLDLDPAKPADGARLEALLGKADICFITPHSGYFSERLDPDALRARYPRLVVVVITPFGRKGPRSGWKASDIEVMAAGGAMSMAGEPDGVPLRVSEPQSYSWVGSHAAAGALTALFKRDATGEGELVDVSAQASVVIALSHAPAFYDLNGVVATRAGAFMWMREKGAELGPLAGIDWARFDPTKADQAEVDAMEAPAMKFFATVTKREYLMEAHKREMLGYPVSTVADLVTDPQIEARGFFQTVEGEQGAERHCGSFAVIDGERPPLRHAAGTSYDDTLPKPKRAEGLP
jgi:crotonobetainyl-CoA:carnitine CoA-transferase CaiB-like acyl-CoA transferase